MAYFWVNQGGTLQAEVIGGCLWAPHFDAKGRKPPHWESMDLLQPGDVVFNYANGLIHGYATIQSKSTSCPRPYSAGTAYSYSQGGRIAFCTYQQLPTGQGLPLSAIVANAPLANDLKNAGVLTRTNSVQQKYLTLLPSNPALQIVNMLSAAGLPLGAGINAAGATPQIPATTVQQIIQARVGQGQFRADLLNAFNSTCPITNLTKTELLRASHIKAWSISNPNEKLDPENGLLLAAGVDAAFDRGLISFDPTGNLLSRLSQAEEMAIGIHRPASLPSAYLTPARTAYLTTHRNASGWRP